MIAFAKTLWEATPKPVQDVVAMAVDRVQGQKIPEPPTAGGTPVKLFIAPANYAGQGYRWARAVELDPRVSARNMVYTEMNPFGYDADFPVRWRTVTHSHRWQRAQLRALTEDFTHVLIEAEFPPLGGLYAQDIRRQVKALQDGGTRVAMVCHGSDIRLPSRHRALEQWSPFQDDGWVDVREVEEMAADHRRLLDDLALPTFVSTPGLLLDVPYAHLLPVVIEPNRWASDTPVLQRSRPRVLHVPSNSLVKGTAEIEPVLYKLHDEGVIEYIREENVSHDSMPAAYAQSDIVLDQFRLGDYGVGACEAMAAGRLVVSHLSDQARDVVAQTAGLPIPILEANIDSLERVLREVVVDRQRGRALAEQGPAFVARLHDGGMARTALEQNFLRS